MINIFFVITGRIQAGRRRCVGVGRRNGGVVQAASAEASPPPQVHSSAANRHGSANNPASVVSAVPNTRQGKSSQGPGLN